jgi:7-cyano-7-deazaguanine synthase
MAHELAAMRSILPQVRGIARASVLDVDLYDRDAICRDFPNEGISVAYGRLAEEFGLGYQYETFALLCEGLGIRAECAVEDSPRSKAKRAIDAQCLLVPCESPCRRGRFRVVSKGASSDAATVLGRLDFGMLDVSKVEAKRMAQESGWMSVMRRTWFCHAPVNGKPCGTCNPCKDAMAEGMRWRMPLSSRLRYHAWHLRSATARLWWPRSG